MIMISSCHKKVEPIDGLWKVIMDVQNNCLPFFMEIKGQQVRLINSDETFDLELKNVGHGIYQVPLSFDENYLEFKYNGSSIDGNFYKKKTDITSEMKISGKRAVDSLRAMEPGDETALAGRWKVDFYNDKNEVEKTTLAIFSSTPQKVLKGSILTKTGDYRFLEGTGLSGKYQLFGFDGQMNFVLDLKVKGDKFEGNIFSGNTWKRKIIGQRDETFSLEDPNSLTKSKDQPVGFKAKNLDGTDFIFNKTSYQNQPVILQILGSWCPNCLDESKFLRDWSKTNTHIPIVGIAFERTDNFKKSVYQVKRLQKNLNLDYKIVIGSIDKDKVKVLDVLKFLENHMSYPTTIFLRKDKSIHSIHTGFSGPATGDAYKKFISMFKKTVSEIQ